MKIRDLYEEVKEIHVDDESSRNFYRQLDSISRIVIDGPAVLYHDKRAESSLRWSAHFNVVLHPLNFKYLLAYLTFAEKDEDHGMRIYGISRFVGDTADEAHKIVDRVGKDADRRVYRDKQHAIDSITKIWNMHVMDIEDYLE